MRTVSLRRRGVGCALAVLAALLVAIFVFVDGNLGRQLRAEQRRDLASLAAEGATLARSRGDQALADALARPGVTVAVTSPDGRVVLGVPADLPLRRVAQAAGSAVTAPSAAAGAAPRTAAGVEFLRRGRRLSAVETVAGSRTLVLSVDGGAIVAAQRRFRRLMLLASAGGLLLAGGALWWVLGRALRPLDVMTATALAIAGGDRGRRLDPDRTDTELGRAAGAFDAMLEELESAEQRARDARERLARFLSDASHELRTPLAGVSAGAEQLLASGLGGEGDQQIAAQVVREARRAGRLVDDLLATSRLDELTLHRERLDVLALARDAATRSGLTAEHASEVEVVDDTGGRPALVDGDRVRLEQVLANLLHNARRAAAGGAVRVRVTAPRDGRGQVVVVVSDTGPGIAVADRERVFERLVRLDAARARDGGGAGLGLAIARGIALAHGGSLVVGDAQAGDLPGAALVLTLPGGPPARRSGVQEP